MSHQLTINLSEEIYEGLINLVGEKNADQFIEATLRPYILIAKKNKDFYIALENQGFKIHSPRLVDRSLINTLKVEMVEESKDASV